MAIAPLFSPTMLQTTRHLQQMLLVFKKCMNLSPGGEQNYNMWAGRNPLTGKPQEMHTLVKGKKVSEGTSEVPKERGLWRYGKYVCIQILSDIDSVLADALKL